MWIPVTSEMIAAVETAAQDLSRNATQLGKPFRMPDAYFDLNKVANLLRQVQQIQHVVDALKPTLLAAFDDRIEELVEQKLKAGRE